MKKSILNLGKTLNKAEQNRINGGREKCDFNSDGICEKKGPLCAELHCRVIPLQYQQNTLKKMKKQILTLGKVLNKLELTQINGKIGNKFCTSHGDCNWGFGCCNGVCLIDSAVNDCK